MKVEEKVKYLGQYLVCQHDACMEPVNICHRDYFSNYHYDVDHNKKITHKSIAFDQSFQYQNFYFISKIQQIATKKVTEAIKYLQTDISQVIQTAIYKSAIFLEIFNSEQAIGEYLYLRNIQNGMELPIYPTFSQTFCSSIILDKKIISKVYRQLCRDSPQLQLLNAQFNVTSGLNSKALQAFIDKQIKYFIQYCQKVQLQKLQFNIKDYINMRNSSNKHEDDLYYTHQFVTFLLYKYETNPQNESIFNILQYYLSFWQYFYVVIDASKNIINYFQEQMSFYRQYQQIMLHFKLTQSFLSYRMWRFNNKTSIYKPSIRNPFFIETYIYTFIEEIMTKKLYYPEEKVSYDYKQFAKYLKDYVKYVKEKQQQFSFLRYRQYSNYRIKNQKFQETLIKNKQIIFNRNYFIQYSNNQFYDGNKLSLKKYKKYYQIKKNLEDQKSKLFRQQIQAVKYQVKGIENQVFYSIIFFNYQSYLIENKMMPTRELYDEFRAKFLQKFDEGYLKEEQERYLSSLQQKKDEVENEEEKLVPQKKKNIVKQSIDQIQEQVVHIMQDQANSQQSQNDGQVQMQEICPCCKGNPYECKEKDCLVIGVCTSCMLD